MQIFRANLQSPRFVTSKHTKSFPDIIFVDLVDFDPVFAKYLQVYYVKTGKSRYICAMCKFVLHKNMTFRTNLRSAIGFVSNHTNRRNLF